MVYFPENVFKNIISFARSPHPIAAMLERELGVWMLALRLNNATNHPTKYTTEERERQKIFDGFFDTPYPITGLTNAVSNAYYKVYKQRFAGARIGDYRSRPTIMLDDTPGRGLFWFSTTYNPNVPPSQRYMCSAKLNPYIFCADYYHKDEITNMDMIRYLKENKIKGYSKKKQIELRRMCMSF